MLDSIKNQFVVDLKTLENGLFGNSQDPKVDLTAVMRISSLALPLIALITTGSVVCTALSFILAHDFYLIAWLANNGTTSSIFSLAIEKLRPAYEEEVTAEWYKNSKKTAELVIEKEQEKDSVFKKVGDKLRGRTKEKTQEIQMTLTDIASNELNKEVNRKINEHLWAFAKTQMWTYQVYMALKQPNIVWLSGGR